MRRFLMLLASTSLATATLAGSVYASGEAPTASPDATRAAPSTILPDSALAGQGHEVALVATAPAHGAAADAALAVSPAGCVANIDDAHIAASVPGAVKVNARITCRRPVQTLTLTVNLYKTVFFGLFASLQATTTASNAGRASIQNQGTFRRCTNAKSTDWFGTAVARSLEGGTVYQAVVRSPHNRTLHCGT